MFVTWEIKAGSFWAKIHPPVAEDHVICMTKKGDQGKFLLYSSPFALKHPASFKY